MNKKVVEGVCTKCGMQTEGIERYVLNCQIADFTGREYVSVFNDVGTKLLGVDAHTLADWKAKSVSLFVIFFLLELFYLILFFILFFLGSKIQSSFRGSTIKASFGNYSCENRRIPRWSKGQTSILENGCWWFYRRCKQPYWWNSKIS